MEKNTRRSGKLIKQKANQQIVDIANLASGGDNKKLSLNSFRIIIKRQEIKLYGHFSLNEKKKKYQNCGRQASTPKLNTIMRNAKQRKSYSVYKTSKICDFYLYY